MNPRWEESGFVFSDLQSAAVFIHRDNPEAANAFLEAAYDAFEFLSRNSEIGRTRADLGFPEIRSWRISGFRRYLVFYRGAPRPNSNLARIARGSRFAPNIG